MAEAALTFSPTGGSSTYYLRDDQGNVLGKQVGSTHLYFLTDHVGSVVAVISGDGQTVADRSGYDPYGNIAYLGREVSATRTGYPRGCTNTTGLVQFGGRYLG